jgi:hypothetical protein
MYLTVFVQLKLLLRELVFHTIGKGWSKNPGGRFRFRKMLPQPVGPQASSPRCLHSAAYAHGSLSRTDQAALSSTDSNTALRELKRAVRR